MSNGEHAVAPAATLEKLRAEWERYRGICFMRAAPLLTWYWTASHEFNFVAAGLFLQKLPGATFDVGTHALMIGIPSLDYPELADLHVVPLTTLTDASLQCLQQIAALDLSACITRLEAAQTTAQSDLDGAVLRAQLWRMPMGDGHAGIQ